MNYLQFKQQQFLNNLMLAINDAEAKMKDCPKNVTKQSVKDAIVKAIDAFQTDGENDMRDYMLDEIRDAISQLQTMITHGPEIRDALFADVFDHLQYIVEL